MKRLIASLFLGCTALTGAAPANAQPVGYGQAEDTVVCESLDGRRAYCDADTRGGMRLLRQISRSDCIEGNTWGFDRRGVWVDAGCRGEFGSRRGGGSFPGGGSGYPGGGQDGGYAASVVCRSEGGRQQVCPFNSGRGRVQLLRRISKTPCVQGQTWGYDRRSVWVSGGCRGEFGVAQQRAEPTLLLCESVQNRRQYCPVNTVYGVELNRQLSRTECTEGYTWGYDRNAIWVDGGCRGEFIVQ